MSSDPLRRPGAASSDPPGGSQLPRGLIGRRGGVVNPSARLPSLRPARDLTLGGVQRKAFKPNLASRKDRSQRESMAQEDQSAQSNSRQRGQRSSRGDRGRGRGRGRGETIQSHSIFEQGPANRLNKKGGGSYHGGGGDSAPSSSTRTVKREKMSEEESKRMKQLLSDDGFISDLKDDKEITMGYTPIHLPLVPSTSVKSEVIKEELDMQIDGEKIVIKTEPVDEGDDITSMDTDQKPDTKTPMVPPGPKKKSLPDRIRPATIFSSRMKSEGELLFFQFPDTLPGQPLQDDDPGPKVKREPGSQSTGREAHKDEESKHVKCTLQNLAEGYLGKLQVLESGATKLVLGNVTLDVSTGTPCGFLQDVMSISLPDDSNSGEIIRLGQVKNRVVCTPDFESLVSLAPSK